MVAAEERFGYGSICAYSTRARVTTKGRLVPATMNSHVRCCVAVDPDASYRRAQLFVAFPASISTSSRAIARNNSSPRTLTALSLVYRTSYMVSSSVDVRPEHAFRQRDQLLRRSRRWTR
jgi:hypothetical protein